MYIDIIIPCYNEETNVFHFYEEVKKIEEKIKNDFDISFHFIYIDDGSTDDTLSKIKELFKMHNEVSFITLDKNYGKEAAIYKGFEESKEKYTILMDIDMQDPPSILPDMIKSVLSDGYHACGAYRLSRKGEPIIRSFFSSVFYRLAKLISKVDIPNGCRDYCIVDEEYRKKILSKKGDNKFFKGVLCSTCDNIKWIGFKHQDRFSGKTKWSFFRLLIYGIKAINSLR